MQLASERQARSNLNNGDCGAHPCIEAPTFSGSDPRPSVRITRGAGSGQHLASVLQEGRKNANIDAGLGFIWRISATMTASAAPPLAAFARNHYSQAGEDGIIERIMQVLPPVADRWCVEFGAWDGEHLSNTAALIKDRNYSAVLIEPEASRFEALKKKTQNNSKVICQQGFVEFHPPDTLDERLARTAVPYDFDLLSIDIDGNDYHVWEACIRYRPRVVVIEFNPTIADEVDYVQPRDKSVQHGCSAAALTRLGDTKGYKAVAITTNNVIFVDEAYYPLFELVDNSVRALRHDRGHVTHLFFGYDGTVLTSGNSIIPWQQIPLSSSRLQQLPRWLRKFPDDYNSVQRIALWYLRNYRKHVLVRE
jgi:hypothetical protein